MIRRIYVLYTTLAFAIIMSLVQIYSWGNNHKFDKQPLLKTFISSR